MKWQSQSCIPVEFIWDLLTVQCYRKHMCVSAWEKTFDWQRLNAAWLPLTNNPIYSKHSHLCLDSCFPTALQSSLLSQIKLSSLRGCFHTGGLRDLQRAFLHNGWNLRRGTIMLHQTELMGELHQELKWHFDCNKRCFWSRFSWTLCQTYALSEIKREI